MVRISAIKYLNTIPFIYGLENSPIMDEIVMDFCTPAESADNLIHDRSDVGIVPVAIIPSLPDPHVISDYCIGATDNVASVLLCSGLPLNEISHIKMDGDSRTSQLLTKVLCRDYWKIFPEFVPFNYEQEGIDPAGSYLLIGDKALIEAERFKYTYDLAREWIDFTGKPFVFACWTANKPLGEEFVKKFNEALRYGIENIRGVIKKHCYQFPEEYAETYLKSNISFVLDSDKRAGLTEFWRVALEKLNPRVHWL
ncbi:MAG TPA: menaquinone biosynthesis protein [Bacteroidales bacterium]|nr:menaquinone biosynthesis protein [Bacteroidales bacterium]HPK30424.1 menaquinone biosynthesis protein [Bacteroidales bacterium]